MKSYVRLGAAVLTIASLLLSCGPLFGAPPKADQIVFTTTIGKLTLTPSDAADVIVTANTLNAADGNAAVLVDGKPKLAPWKFVLTIVQPGPNPNPNPQPDPQPNPTPTPGPLYVLVVYESADLVRMPISQVSILTSKPIRDYLGTHCAKDSKGTPEFRFLDKDANVSKLDPNLQKWFAEGAAKMKAAGKPWLTATNGKDVLSKELPATPDAVLETLKPIGGK